MINQRIELLYGLIPKANIVADVGCDHGLLINKLAQSNKAKIIIGSEISPQSLQKAIKNFDKNHSLVKTIFLLSDGFDNYDCNLLPDCVIIAGMGGSEIVKILSKYKFLNTISCLILQPMHDQEKLREFLLQHFKIDEDFVVKIKNKFYNYMRCFNGCDKLSKEEIVFGKTCFTNKMSNGREYLDFKLNKFEEYIKSAIDKNEQKILSEKIELMKKVREKYYGENS